ncbi:MAG: glycosyltransferase family 4 protein [Chthoniobacterales bacterium]
MHKPLRILMIVDLAWANRLGAIRVFAGLAEAWRLSGHTVEKYSLKEAYAKPARRRFVSLFRRLMFPWKAAVFVRQNRERFDVIESLLGALPFPKQRLQFDGLVVARSVGFYQLYPELEKAAAGEQRRGKLLGRLFYSFFNRILRARSERALRNCDLLNLPNEHELKCLRQQGLTKPALVQPYGLAGSQRRKLLQSAAPPVERLSAKKVSCIGMWSPRKGACDWRRIIDLVRAAVPDARFLFLGTFVEDRQVLDDIGLGGADFIELVTQYKPGQLPQLLGDSTVGAFPSYAEAFGFGLLEQLAARVPCVAYASAGPRLSLENDLPELLVPVGDVEKFAETLVRILSSERAEYKQLAKRSAETAVRFDWATIAQETFEAYLAHLPAARAEMRP